MTTIERIQRGTPATLSVTFYGDETPVDSDVPVSVTIMRADGSELSTGTADHGDEGVYTYVLPPQSNLNNLSVAWTGQFNGSAATLTTDVEIVGGNYFSISELRAYDSVLANKTRYPYATLVNARAAVEAEFEGICGRAFVPRYARERLVGDVYGQIWLSNPEPLRVLSCTVNGDDWSDRTFSGSSDNLRIVTLDRPISGNQWWETFGLDDTSLGVYQDHGIYPRASLIIIEYEFGKNAVPVRIKNAALKRAKHALVAGQSRIDERATTMNIPEFGNFVLATPGMRGSYTGIPEVDVVLADYVIGTL